MAKGLRRRDSLRKRRVDRLARSVFRKLVVFIIVIVALGVAMILFDWYRFHGGIRFGYEEWVEGRGAHR